MRIATIAAALPRPNAFMRNLGAMGASQLITRVSRLVTTVILAHMLAPRDYGAAAIVLTIYEIVALFTRNGISANVVRASAETVQETARTAYWLTWIVCGVLMIAQAAIAVPAAIMFHDMRLAAPIALMGLIYLATPVSNIQCAFLLREARVGRIALAQTAQVTADNVLTAGLAIAGFGMWAIVLPKLLVAPIWAITIRYSHAWRNSGAPTLAGWRPVMRFARDVLGVEVLTTVQANADNLIVGYFLGTASLGTYYFAFNAGLGISLGLISAFGIAVYPHLCAAAGDQAELARRYRGTLRTLALIMLPLIVAQIALAPVYVPLVFGAKWAGAVPVLMVICASALPRPFAGATSQLLKAAGRPDIELRWQAGLTVVLIAALAVAAQFSILAVAVAVCAVQGVMLTGFCLRAPRIVLRAAPDEAPRVDRVLLIGIEAGRWGAARLARPLAEAGFAVATLAPDDNALSHTDFAVRRFALPHTRAAWRIEKALAGAMADWNPALIIPADEPTVACLHETLRRAKRGRTSLPANAVGVLARAMGPESRFAAKLMKSETQALAKSLGIAVPHGETVRNSREALAASHRIGFPVFVKSSFSWAGRGVVRCGSAAELTAAMRRRPRAIVWARRAIKIALDRAWWPSEPAMDVQQAVNGTPAMYCAVAVDGKILAGFAGFALRTTSETGPSSIVRIGPHAAMAAASEAITAALGITGFIGFDFMIEGGTRAALFLECNPRPIQVGHLAPLVGTDLCEALANGLRGAPVTAPVALGDATVALFPQEWQRDPDGITALPVMLDVPWADASLLEWMRRWSASLGGPSVLPSRSVSHARPARADPMPARAAVLDLVQ